MGRRRQSVHGAGETCQGPQIVAEVSLRGCHHTAWFTHLVLICVSLQLILCLSAGTQNQEPFGVNPPQRPEPLAPPFPQESPAPTLPRPELPPVPPVPPGESQRLPLPRLFVRQIEVTGNTVFSDADLA